MATAQLVQESMTWWAPGTNLYALSEPFNGHDHIAVMKVPTGTSVLPATQSGVGVPDPNGFGLMAHRSWYPPIDHARALTEIGYDELIDPVAIEADGHEHLEQAEELGA